MTTKNGYAQKVKDVDEEEDEDFGIDMALFGEERVNLGGPNSPPVIWTCPTVYNGSISLLCSSTSSTGLMAHHVWQSSICLSTILAKQELLPYVHISSTSNILELGAGAALPSLVCDLVLNAGKVIATDYPDPYVLEAMKLNALNNHASKNLKVSGFCWGDDPSTLLSEFNGDIDYIIAADTLWIEKYHSILLKSIKDLMGMKTKLVMSFMHHDHDGSTASRFLTALLHEGFRIEHEFNMDWRTSENGKKDRSKLDYGDVMIKVIKRSS
jgi:predicted nicotinamide N-methyase